jgi:hypothetical protein
MPSVTETIEERIRDLYGLSRSSVESQIILAFEMVAVSRGLYIRKDEAVIVRNFASRIIEFILGEGGAGRLEPTGRRYSSRERDMNFQSACHFSRKVAERTVQRARESGEMIQEEIYIGDRRVRFSTSSALFASLCPPALKPIC